MEKGPVVGAWLERFLISVPEALVVTGGADDCDIKVLIIVLSSRISERISSISRDEVL